MTGPLGRSIGTWLICAGIILELLLTLGFMLVAVVAGTHDEYAKGAYFFALTLVLMTGADSRRARKGLS